MIEIICKNLRNEKIFKQVINLRMVSTVYFNEEDGVITFFFPSENDYIGFDKNDVEFINSSIEDIYEEAKSKMK